MTSAATSSTCSIVSRRRTCRRSSGTAPAMGKVFS
jgi:hypothetical protein